MYGFCFSNKFQNQSYEDRVTLTTYQFPFTLGLISQNVLTETRCIFPSQRNLSDFCYDRGFSVAPENTLNQWVVGSGTTLTPNTGPTQAQSEYFFFNLSLLQKWKILYLCLAIWFVLIASFCIESKCISPSFSIEQHSMIYWALSCLCFGYLLVLLSFYARNVLENTFVLYGKILLLYMENEHLLSFYARNVLENPFMLYGKILLLYIESELSTWQNELYVNITFFLWSVST